MTRGKLIVIDGTDCSGKETQTEMLVRRLRGEGVRAQRMSFPRYHTPTGKIIAGPYLGKPELIPTWFPEGPTHVDALVASGLYAVDRRAALPEMEGILAAGDHLVLDRYGSANKGHQGGKLATEAERRDLWRRLDLLEYEVMGVPRPDHSFFLYMPWEVGAILKGDRTEGLDGHEADENHLRQAEAAYLQLAREEGWSTIECAPDRTRATLKNRDQTHEELYALVRTLL